MCLEFVSAEYDIISIRLSSSDCVDDFVVSVVLTFPCYFFPPRKWMGRGMKNFFGNFLWFGRGKILFESWFRLPLINIILLKLQHSNEHSQREKKNETTNRELIPWFAFRYSHSELAMGFFLFLPIYFPLWSLGVTGAGA